MILREDHSLVFYLSFPVILGLLPVSLAIKTTGCGIKKSEFSDDEPEDPGIGSEYSLYSSIHRMLCLRSSIPFYNLYVLL